MVSSLHLLWNSGRSDESRWRRLSPARDRISSKSRDHRTTNGPRAERPICHLHFWILKRLPAILQSLGTHYSCRCSIVLVLLTQNTQSTPKYPHKRTFQRKNCFEKWSRLQLQNKHGYKHNSYCGLFFNSFLFLRIFLVHIRCVTSYNNKHDCVQWALPKCRGDLGVGDGHR